MRFHHALLIVAGCATTGNDALDDSSTTVKPVQRTMFDRLGGLPGFSFVGWWSTVCVH
jgi:hypothetical protein